MLDRLVRLRQELDSLMDAGQISIGIFIPEDFDRRVIGNGRQIAQLLVDGTDPIILGVAQQLTAAPVAFSEAGRKGVIEGVSRTGSWCATTTIRNAALPLISYRAW